MNLSEYQLEYQRSIDNPESFWEEKANTFSWVSSGIKYLTISPKVEWFVGGKLNITENCLDRHLKLRSNKVAII